MKLVGVAVVGPGEGDRWLKPFLDQYKKLCDNILICQNNTDPKTQEVIRKANVHTYHDDREWGIYQPKIKEKLVQLAGHLLHPDWILFLDADEFLDRRFTRAKAEQLASQRYDISYFFWVVEFWNNSKQYRTDMTFETVRYFKYFPRVYRFNSMPLHCGNVPELIGKWGSHTDLIIKHYGLIRPRDRQRKVERYQKYDPNGKWLNKDWYKALSSKSPPLEPFDENKFVKTLPEAIYRKKMVTIGL